MSTDIQALTDSVKKKANWLKWGLGIGAVALVAPFIWMMVYAMLGVAALGAATLIAIGVGLALVNLSPVLAMKFQNAKIKAIIAEAEKNPIPTLWEGHRKDAEELAEMNKAIEDYATEINNVRSRMQSLSKDLSQEDKDGFENDIATLEQDLTLQEQDYEQAMTDHAAQEVQIKRASAIWDLNMAVNKASSKNMNRAEETMAKIKRETALDAVNASMNRSKAQLRARIRARANAANAGPGKPALTHQPADVIEMEPAKDVTYALRK